MRELLETLAQKLNICTEFTFECGGIKKVVASDELLRFLIESMGYSAKNEEDIKSSLVRLEKRRWQYPLESIYVVDVEDKVFDIVLDKGEAKGDIEVTLAKEGAKSFSKLEIQYLDEEARQDGRIEHVKKRFKINTELSPQYYTLKVKTNKKEYQCMLAVAPKTCYALDKKGKEKIFGFALQLYSLKSRRNWGVGDFTDLENMIDILARSGGDIIGLNPLNVLHHNDPELASPYASISRLFLNPIYIDVEKVPFYQKEDKNEEEISKIKQQENINYSAVYQAKMQALRNIYERVLSHTDSDYMKQFKAYKKENFGELDRLALFQVIADKKAKEGKYDVASWGKDLSSAMAKGIGRIANEYQEEVDFFKFLQFEAERQLKLVEQKIKQRDMAVGLYRDLPVGVAQDSAEVWDDKYLYMQGSGAGAPPDNCFPTGQKWMLGAFNPFELKERCYKPFIKILRANMKGAGAIRIDHIMGLSRLYIIPNDMEEGTYVRYNEKDMFNILALESYLNKCVIVGECIGNVADGFKEALKQKNIYSLGVLWVERKDDCGNMKAPEEYEREYFSSVGTHDMPPLKAWWFGHEIGLMKELKLYSSEEAECAYHWREHERQILLSTLDYHGVWPTDRYRHADYLYGEGYPEGIDEAVTAYMAKTNSEVFMLQPEDVFQSMKIQNLPGTDIDKYPNWRSRLPVDIEDIEENESYKRHMDIVKKYR